jgi:predicted transcriptional regulator
MARTPHDVTEAELAVLQALWERGPSTRRDLAALLYPRGGTAGYTTVQKLLERLHAKGHVVEQPGQEERTFAATISREALVGRRLRDVADQLCEGSLTSMLTTLVRAESLTPREVRELTTLLEELKKQPPVKNPRR